MALAVLDLSPTARVATSSRVLSPAEWKALSGVIHLQAQAQAALEQAQVHACDSAVADMRARAERLERQLQKMVLLKALNLQVQHERELRDLRARFVETVLGCLRSLLLPTPPSFFARVQASAATMIGEASKLTLQVAAADEAAARAGLAVLASHVRVVVDPDLSPGQCFLETHFGRIQAGLTTQLEALGEALQPWWEGESSQDVQALEAALAHNRPGQEAVP
jgi:flagellar biosynthesis/type III secretory pathway protein FliH